MGRWDVVVFDQTNRFQQTHNLPLFCLKDSGLIKRTKRLAGDAEPKLSRVQVVEKEAVNADKI